MLEQIATLLELKDENPFKIRAYTNAARSIETFGGNLAELKDEETLEKIPGIGKAIAAKIKELAETGSLKFFDELRAEFPGAILELFSIPGFGREKNQGALRETEGQLNRGTAGGMRDAEKSRNCPVSAKRRRRNFARPSPNAPKHTRFVSARPDRGRSRNCCRTDLRAHPDALQVCIAGSYRRRKEIVRDLDFIVATNEPEEITRVIRSASAGGKRHRAGTDEEQRSFALRNSMRSARGQFGRVSVCARIILPAARNTTS